VSRCVECGGQKANHLLDGRCSILSQTTYKSMDLPIGENCSGCGNFGFCRKFLGEQIATNTTCDWYPIRFIYAGPRIAHVEPPKPAPAGNPGEANA